MAKRILDLIISIIGSIMLSPIFILLAFWIKIDSGGSVFLQANESREKQSGFPVVQIDQ